MFSVLSRASKGKQVGSGPSKGGRFRRRIDVRSVGLMRRRG
jgi:hypothetical protein